MFSRHTFALPAMLACAPLQCFGQQAIVTVSHNDPDGIVVPGQMVTVTTMVSWTGHATYLEEIRGGVLASPDLGIAAGSVFPHTNYASIPGATIVNPGTPVGGSIVGIHLYAAAATWVLFGAIALPWQVNSGFEILRFTWTAPLTAGVVNLDFAPDPLLADPTFLGPSLTPFTLPTTYLGTSLTVIPGPASAAVLAIAVAALGRRRRGW